MMANKKRLGRRALSLLMALVMSFSLLQVSAFADGTLTAEQKENKAAQVVRQGDQDTVVREDKVWTTKTVAATEEEGKFEVTLQVKTKDVIQQITSTESASVDVVLLIDASNSMTSGRVDRLAAAKTAARSFANTFLANNEDGKRRVSVVSYGSEVLKSFDLTASATTVGRNVDQVVVGGDLGGTNIQAGLRGAEAKLSNSEAAYKIIVLLTDGEPTYCYQGTGTGAAATSIIGVGSGSGRYAQSRLHTTFERYRSGNGYSGRDNTVDADIRAYSTVSEARRIQATGIDIYGVGMDISNNNMALYTMYNVVNHTTDPNGNPSYAGYYFDYDSSTGGDLGTSLSSYFELIATNILVKTHAWWVHDEMGEHVDFAGFVEGAQNGATVDASGTIDWNLKAPSVTITRDDDLYVYTTKYYVTLDKATYPANTPIDTNSTATLTYAFDDEVYEADQGDHKKGEMILYTHEITTPQVQGYRADLAFTKVNEDGQPLMGAKFKLEMVDDDLSWSREATSDANGTVTFAGIPSASKYVLTEVKAPDGYNKAEEPVDVTVSYGVLTADIKNGEIVNILKQAFVDVPVTKTWRKPATEGTASSIELSLLQDGTAVETVTVTAADCEVSADGTVWTYTFKNMPKYKSAGVEYKYTVKETSIAGWTTTYTEDGRGVINTVNGTTSVSVTKNWILPEGMDAAPAVTVELLKNGEPTGETKSLVYSKDGDTQEFLNLPKYDDAGQLIVYTVREASGNYQMAGPIVYGTEGAANTAVITNTVADETTTVSGTKHWNDDATGRPESVTVTLYADGVEAATTTATADTEWKYSFTDLKRYEFTKDGDVITGVREIVYTVEETPVEGYVSSVVGYEITNTRTGEVGLTVNKEWVDLDDSARSDIEVQVYANGQAYGETVWMTNTYTFEKLPKYDERGLEIKWSVQELAIPMGYTPSYSEMSADADGNLSVTITNTQDSLDDTMVVTVTKVWQQPGDVSAKEATFILYADGVEMADKKLVLSGNNVGSFTDLPKYKEVKTEDGESDWMEIEYTVKEESVSGYATGEQHYVANSNGDIVYHFTNTIKGKTSVSVQKQWVKPDSVKTPDVTFHVQRTTSGEWEDVGTIVLENGKTSGKLSGLEQYNDYGRRYTYRIQEMPVSGYSAAVSGGLQENGAYAFDVTNTINPATTNVVVSKTWVDGGLADSERPSVKLYVLQDNIECGWVEFVCKDGVVMAIDQSGVEVEATVSGNTWSHTFQLPKYSQDLSKEYTYSVAEYDVPAGYKSAVEDTTATNTRVGTIDIPVTKYWVDPVGTDRPEITLTLTGSDNSVRTIVMRDDADGVVTAALDGESLDVTVAGSAWTVNVAGLPKYDVNGAEIAYSLDEAAVSGYDKETVEGDRFAILNRIRQDETASADADKLWDNMDVTGVNEPAYPDSITVGLLRDGQLVAGSTKKVEKATDNTYDIPAYTDLAKYDTADGHAYKYQVVELNEKGEVLVDGSIVSFGKGNDYKVTYSEDGKTITNAYVVPAEYFYVIKTYYKHYDADGNLISDYQVESDLYTEETSKTVTVDPAEYVVCPEDQLTYKYTPDDTDVTEVTLEEVNHIYELVLHYELHDQKKSDPPSSDTRLTVNKVWKNDSADVRPENIEVQLLCDGEAYGKPETLSADNNWKHTWYNLDKSCDWSVEEVEVPEGYTADVTGKGTSWTITNTLDEVDIPDEEPPTTDIPSIPDVDIPDEDVPTSDVPKTGDNMALWLLAAAVSGLGLVWMALTGKKREENA